MFPSLTLVSISLAILARAAPASLFLELECGLRDQQQSVLGLHDSPQMFLPTPVSPLMGPALQTTAPWGLARIAQKPALVTMGQKDPHELPPRAMTLDWSFPYDTLWGTDIIVYIVDSGVRASHHEFDGRVEAGHVIERLRKSGDDKGMVDHCGHGTSVASLVAGKTLGVARQAKIVPVRVADKASCSRVPSTSRDVAEGVIWAVNNYKTRAGARAGIINISWGVWNTPESLKAFEEAIAAGLHIVVSAGNTNKNQCFGGTAPPEDQRVKDVGQLMAGNMDWNDARFDEGEDSGSNHGSCLTLFAPGTSMTVASWDGDNAFAHGGWDETGTSYSAPLVAGTIAALVTKHGNAPPHEMRTLLLKYAHHNAGLKNLKGSPDIVLNALLESTKLQ